MSVPVIHAVEMLAARHLTPAQMATLRSFVRFGLVGTSGLVVDTAALYAALGVLGLYGGAVASYVVASTWTWWFNRMWTFRGQGSGPLWRQWLRFMAVNLLGFFCNRAMYVGLVMEVEACRAYPALALAAGAVAGLFANFALSRRLVFR